MPDEPLQAKLDPRDASLDPQLVWKGDGRSVLSVQRHHKDIQESRSGPYKFEGEAFYPSNGRHWSLDPSTGDERHSPKNFVVEIKGVDVYDPTTGEIRSHSTDDIACWFIGTNYDGKRFFVRHADFTGADQPFDKLKRALKADIDEAAWSALYFNHQPAVPRATQGQDRREGHQPLRRRSIEGLLGEVPWRSFTR